MRPNIQNHKNRRRFIRYFLTLGMMVSVTAIQRITNLPISNPRSKFANVNANKIEHGNRTYFTVSGFYFTTDEWSQLKRLDGF